MAREGGYGKSTKAEWLRTDRKSYADALTSSASMGQELEMWLADAIAFHAYHCEVMTCAEQYRNAEAEAQASMRPAADPDRYRPTRQRPTITPSRTGQGSGPATGRSYRP